MSAWKEEADQDDMDHRVARAVNLEGPRVYRRTFRLAQDMKKQGEAAENIRKHLDTEPLKYHPPRADLSLEASRLHERRAEEYNTIQMRLSTYRKDAIADVLAGKATRF